jgi:hypothetical protein
MHRSRRTICLCPAAAECRGGEPKVRSAEGVGAAPFASKGAGFSRRVTLTAPMNPAGRSQNVSLIHAFSIDYRPIRNSFNPLDIRQQLSRFVSDNSELLMHTFPANPLHASFYKLGTRVCVASPSLGPIQGQNQRPVGGVKASAMRDFSRSSPETLRVLRCARRRDPWGGFFAGSNPR